MTPVLAMAVWHSGQTNGNCALLRLLLVMRCHQGGLAIIVLFVLLGTLGHVSCVEIIIIFNYKPVK